MAFENLDIVSPKREKRHGQGWAGFFPYYAGYTEEFAQRLIGSSELPASGSVFDPWNGSGTTLHAASQLGFRSIGFDLNPVMILVSRARMLAPTEADSLEPLAQEIVSAMGKPTITSVDDPLLIWFKKGTALTLRSLQQSISHHLIGDLSKKPSKVHFENMSSIAATYLVALFAVCRSATQTFRSSNPTWLKAPEIEGEKIGLTRRSIIARFMNEVRAMASALSAQYLASRRHSSIPTIQIQDSTCFQWKEKKVDLVLTSPPYCTRLDYTAATRIELALVAPLLDVDIKILSRKMLGSVKVPPNPPRISMGWGDSCLEFLARVNSHPSKASSGYYLKSHLDYFNKLSNSIACIAGSVRPRGTVIMVAQDSYYKDVHNDLAKIITEMCEINGLMLGRREDFIASRSMAGIHKYKRNYEEKRIPAESVLCFRRI